MLSESIFKNKIPDFEKLRSVGFIERNGKYVYSCKIVDAQFNLSVLIDKDGTVKTRLNDTETNEEYVLHLLYDTTGPFIGRVRSEFCAVLQTIADKGFRTKTFSAPYTLAVMDYVQKTYGSTFEFLWEKFPQNAAVRRQDNKKWFAVILCVAKNKIGLSGTDPVEIIDLRAEKTDVPSIVDGQKYFAGYHMNKKSWITICLDGSVPINEIFQRLDASYILAGK